jgi:hypothetical protein
MCYFCLVADSEQHNLAALFASLPKALEEREKAASLLLEAFRQESAKYLLPQVRALIQVPPDDFAGKQELANRINSLCHAFGVGLTHPSMSKVCGITATNSQTTQTGWLRLSERQRLDKMALRSPPTTSLDLDDLNLISAPFGFSRAGRSR